MQDMELQKSEKEQTPRRQTLTLVMTEHCNLQCTYCYERQKKDKTVLSLELAQKEIRDAFQRPGFDELHVNFFGGEPLVAFSRIKEICEWVWSNDWPIPYMMFATTNGTLVHGKIREWFDTHKKGFILSVSLDGTREMHNKNRSNSYDEIDFEFFKKSWPLQTCKTTFSPYTIGSMAEGIIHLHKLGFHPNACPAGGMDWTEEHYDLYAREMKKLADFYLENPDILPCSLLTVDLDRVALAEEYKSTGRPNRIPNGCGAGNGIVCVDRCGKKYPCQTFLPMSGGREQDFEASVKLLKSEDNAYQEKCKNCPILAVCSTCYGSNYVRTGIPFMRSEHDCAFSKIRTKAAAYFFSEMIVQKERNYAYLKQITEGDLLYIIKGIKLVDSSLSF